MRLSEYGLKNGINEVIGITKGRWLNTAPLGIIVDDEDSQRAKVRLYKSHTRDNVEKGCDLWVNVVFDPIVFVISAFDDLGEGFFDSLEPPVLKSAISWARFTTRIAGSFAELKLVEGGVTGSNTRAINRGLNSIIEALVHATRFKISPTEELRNKILYYGEIVNKCGGEDEKKAYKLILKYTGLSSIL
ncbi:MAG TPA: DUF447 family protein [Archaeoglobaceae archaeon]|nr:DUF447 family protein [Archaeoglobaceae archaeon]